MKHRFISCKSVACVCVNLVGQHLCIRCNTSYSSVIFQIIFCSICCQNSTNVHSVRIMIKTAVRIIINSILAAVHIVESVRNLHRHTEVRRFFNLCNFFSFRVKTHILVSCIHSAVDICNKHSSSVECSTD